MKIKKHLLIIGAATLLAAPFALALKPSQPLKTHAATVHNFDIVYEQSRTTKDDIYNYIGSFTFGFAFQYQGSNVNMFPTVGDGGQYLNDHANIVTDGSGNPIAITEGIILNGKALSYWINYDVSNTKETAFPGSSGTHQFPLDVNSGGYKFSSAAVWLKKYRMEVRVNLALFQMDDIKITFDKNYFWSYADGYDYKLVDDVTFYSTIDPNHDPNCKPNEMLTFVEQKDELIGKYGINHVSVSPEQTNNDGYKYHYYQLHTNIKKDGSMFVNPVPTDHDRYMYGSILLNGKPLTYYNAYARAHSWDFLDLTTPTQNPKYETGHASGSVNTRYDLACRIDLALDKNYYLIAVYISNQCLEDFGIVTPTFELRDGSTWLSLDENGNSIVTRHSPSAFNNYIASAIESLETYVDLTLYSEEDIANISMIIYEAQANIVNAQTFGAIDELVAEAKVEIDQYHPQSENIQDAIAFVAGFKTAMATACSASNKQQEVESAWSIQATTYAALIEGVKVIILEGNESSIPEIVEFAERYLAIKGQHPDWTLANFLDWEIPPISTYNVSTYENRVNPNTTLTIIIIIGVVSAVSLISLVILRRRKNK